MHLLCVCVCLACVYICVGVGVCAFVFMNAWAGVSEVYVHASVGGWVHVCVWVCMYPHAYPHIPSTHTHMHAHIHGVLWNFKQVGSEAKSSVHRRQNGKRQNQHVPSWDWWRVVVRRAG